MAKQEIQETEYTWDDGTYQTGATPPSKGQSATITALLIAVIFLGGLASALGLMNIRLLTALTQEQQNPALPISNDGTQGIVEDFFRENQDHLPSLPEEGEVHLQIANGEQPISGQKILENNNQCVLNMTVQTSQNQSRTGPAVVLSSDGYLLTNAHLTENASQIMVQLSNGEQLRAVVVATDAYSDLAVLYVGVQGLESVVFAQETAVFSAGDTAYALVQHDVLSQGNVLSGNRQFFVGGDTITLQKTDLDGDHGPVFNRYGQLNGYLCRYFGEDGGGLMLGSQQVMEIVADLVHQGGVQGRPTVHLDVMQLSNFSRQYWNLSGGLQITRITAGSAAEETGLLQGDILLSADSVALNSCQQFYDLLCSGKESITLEVFRAGQYSTVTLPIGQNP